MSTHVAAMLWHIFSLRVYKQNDYQSDDDHCRPLLQGKCIKAKRKYKRNKVNAETIIKSRIRTGSYDTQFTEIAYAHTQNATHTHAYTHTLQVIRILLMTFVYSQSLTSHCLYSFRSFALPSHRIHFSVLLWFCTLCS